MMRSQLERCRSAAAASVMQEFRCTGTFDRLPDEFYRSLDRLSDHSEAQWLLPMRPAAFQPTQPAVDEPALSPKPCMCRLAAVMYIVRCLPPLLAPRTPFGALAAFLAGAVCAVAGLLILAVRPES